jgi:hypothetical protein
LRRPFLMSATRHESARTPTMFPLLKKLKPPREPAIQLERAVAVNGRSIPLTIRKNSRATRITLRIEPGGRALKMTIPPGLRERDIDDFLDRHQGWLSTKLKRQKTAGSIEDGGEILVRGVPHRIVHTGQLRGLTQSIDSEIGHVLSVSGLEDHLPRRVADFLKKEARRDLEQLVALPRKECRQAGQEHEPEGYPQPLGLLFLGWQAQLLLAHRDGAALVIDYLAAHEVRICAR